MTQKHYIPIIDYLKAFAIVLVTTTHFFTYDEKDFLLFIYVIQMGMPLFMFISSYNFAMSATRHGFTSLADLYAPAQMKKHFGAILPAYILMFVFEFLWTMLAGSRYSVGEVLSAFISGGLNGGSHGGYFFCIYWQFLLFAPLLYLLLRRYPTQTLFAALVIDMAYEWLVGAIDIPRDLNRLLFVRYLFIATFGLYFNLYRSRVRLWLVGLLALASLTYITASNFTASIGRSRPIGSTPMCTPAFIISPSPFLPSSFLSTKCFPAVCTISSNALAAPPGRSICSRCSFSDSAGARPFPACRWP